MNSGNSGQRGQSGPAGASGGQPGSGDGQAELPAIGEQRPSDSHVGLLDVEETVDRVVLGAGDDTAAEALPARVFTKLLSGLATVLALIGLSYALPLEWAQPWRVGEDYVPFWNLIGRELLGQGAEVESDAAEAARTAEAARAAEREVAEPVDDRQAVAPPPKTDEVLRYPEYRSHELDPAAGEVEQALENPEALASFYAALTHTDIGYAHAVTRAGHWGDSVLGNDGITAAIRRRMQARFGDAGHGFHALRKYDASYRHQGVRFTEKESVRWSMCFIRNRCMKQDGRYGYGGVTVWSSGGAQSEFATVKRGPVGRKLSRVELWFQQRPGGGKFRVKVEGTSKTGPQTELTEIIETGLPEGSEPVDAWAAISVPDGPHRVSVRAAGGGRVRAYGVVLERDGPGVVWDGMALIGAFTSRLTEFNEAHLAAQLRQRQLDLMVFTLGGNDMARERSDLRRTMDPYIEDYRRVLQLFRRARPEAACLVMAPVDHGERVGGRVVSRKIVPRMVEAQREVALAEGCAFFDTFAAMGGDGAVARWKSEGLISGDLAHPTARGHKLLGAMVFRALMAGYIEFRRARVGRPLAPPPTGRGVPATLELSVAGDDAAPTEEVLPDAVPARPSAAGAPGVGSADQGKPAQPGGARGVEVDGSASTESGETDPAGPASAGAKPQAEPG